MFYNQCKTLDTANERALRQFVPITNMSYLYNKTAVEQYSLVLGGFLKILFSKL
jgi:hypothetical protein